MENEEKEDAIIGALDKKENLRNSPPSKLIKRSFLTKVPEQDEEGLSSPDDSGVSPNEKVIVFAKSEDCKYIEVNDDVSVSTQAIQSPLMFYNTKEGRFILLAEYEVKAIY